MGIRNFHPFLSFWTFLADEWVGGQKLHRSTEWPLVYKNQTWLPWLCVPPGALAAFGHCVDKWRWDLKWSTVWFSSDKRDWFGNSRPCERLLIHLLNVSDSATEGASWSGRKLLSDPRQVRLWLEMPHWDGGVRVWPRRLRAWARPRDGAYIHTDASVLVTFFVRMWEKARPFLVVQFPPH